MPRIHARSQGEAKSNCEPPLTSIEAKREQAGCGKRPLRSAYMDPAPFDASLELIHADIGLDSIVVFDL